MLVCVCARARVCVCARAGNFRLMFELALRMRGVLAVATAVARVPSHAEAVATLLAEAATILDCERTSLLVVKHGAAGAPAVLESLGALGLDEAAGAGAAIRMPADSGIAGWALAHAKAVAVQDAYADMRFNAKIDAKTG